MKIAVLVSGGVDSAVALAMLKDQGHDVTAFYLKIWLEDELSYLGECPWQEDLAYVQRVCEQLNVPLQVVSLQKEYWDHVVHHTISEIKAGRTPNPDVLCNARIKFGAFCAYLDDSFDMIASGHYATIKHDGSEVQITCSRDLIKDQSYFLAQMSSDQLRRLICPLGGYTKQEVRRYAHTYNLATKDRKDSQGICFLGKLKFRDFVKAHLGEKTGAIKEFETGNILGEHTGFWFYTIGQRQGLGLAGGPWYVVKKDPESNTVFVSRNYYTSEKERSTFTIESEHWFSDKPRNEENLYVKLRHGPGLYACNLASDGLSTRVYLKGRDQGIAPGQYAVFYKDGICLGSGVISE